MKMNLKKNLKQVDEMTEAIRKVKKSVIRLLKSRSNAKMLVEYQRLMRLPGWQGRCLPHCYLLSLMEGCDSLTLAKDISRMIRDSPTNCHAVLHRWIGLEEACMYERLGWYGSIEGDGAIY